MSNCPSDNKVKLTLIIRNLYTHRQRHAPEEIVTYLQVEHFNYSISFPAKYLQTAIGTLRYKISSIYTSFALYSKAS